MSEEKLTSHDLAVMLEKRYCAPEWSFFREVRDATGGGTRSADGLAMNMWPSRGLAVHGFEIKVSRQDWLRELKNPEKSQAIQRFCDHWWIVVSNKEIIRPGELPATWGLMVPRAKALVAIIDAPKLEARPLDRGFVASVLRNAKDSFTTDEAVAARIREAKVAGIEEGKNNEKWKNEHRIRELEDLKAAVAEFERQSGVHLSKWDGGRIGEAVKAVLADGPNHFKNILRDLIAKKDLSIKSAESYGRQITEIQALVNQPGEIQ